MLGVGVQLLAGLEGLLLDLVLRVLCRDHFLEPELQRALRRTMPRHAATLSAPAAGLVWARAWVTGTKWGTLLAKGPVGFPATFFVLPTAWPLSSSPRSQKCML